MCRGVYTSDKGAGGFSLLSRHVVGKNLRDEVRHIASFYCSAQTFTRSYFSEEIPAPTRGA